MNLHDKHSIALMHKEGFDINFSHYMKLEGNYNTLEIAEELGVSIKEAMIIKKKISRT